MLSVEVLAEAQASLREPAAPSRGFVVSITKRGQHRKLHAIQACPYVPGRHYKEWHWHGELMPSEADFDSMCGRCLPVGGAAPEESDSGSSAGSSSSSTSSGDKEPPSKKQRPAKANLSEVSD